MTSKEALEIIKNPFTCCHYGKKHKEASEVIEKDLEVLEILKKKEIAIDELKNCIKHDSEDRPALEEYNAFAGDKKSLTQEEYMLLKEWLSNE